MVKVELVSFVDDDSLELSLSEFCRACGINADDVLRYIDYCVIEPPVKAGQWCFNSVCIRRVQQAGRLQQDLGLNSAGVALALDLIEELELLRTRLDYYAGG
ncbi:MAG: chaperone modulatory protein CbpM [Arenicella sp.]|jgi:chaperone modulatory protein CbpM